ncbi:MAG TPA: MFS transporter [Pirellulales bacterium]|nr:MFS transporter [Pirellulales bacterium]
MFTPSPTLKSRNFIGLVLAQFLAAFNDQASHIVALFYATDMLVRFVAIGWIDAKAVISIVTACFITPFFLFSPLAGVLADKYSKRNIVVFWKLAEVGIMAVALFALVLPHTAGWGWASQQALAIISSVLMISVVFLMGTHSAFFIPAKYGMMPEIVDTSVLSRGNGFLEGASFVATILGTVFGGAMYGWLWIKSEIDSTAMVNILHPGREWVIGLVLFLLALVGAAASMLIRRIPAAAPEMPLTFNPIVPLKKNLTVLNRSRPLILAAIGIAFFALMTLYLRQCLLFQGETIEEIVIASRLPKPPAATAQALSAVRQENEGQSGETASPLSKTETIVSEESPEVADAVAANAPFKEEQHTEESKASRIEWEVSILLGMVGLGVGIGCSLAGYFSGNRLELGLVPIGLSLLIATTAALSLVVPNKYQMIGCLIAVGVAAGLYIVPLYTLLQHRSPKESKGNLVATSNFLNVVGGLLAVLVFYFITARLQGFLGLTLHMKAVKSHPDLITAYQGQLIRALRIPKILFLFASLITLVMLALAWWQRPDFILRAISWIRSSRRRHSRALGFDNIPANGQVILISNSHDFDHWILVVSTVDRFTRFVAPPDARGDRMLRDVALSTGVMIAANRKVQLSAEDNALARGLVTLGQNYLLGLSLAEDFSADAGQAGHEGGEHLLAELRAKVPATILPVYCGEQPTHPEEALRFPRLHTYVVIGEPLPPDTPLAEIRAAVAALGT